jgi:Flp pilus assembly protein TadG
LRKKRTARRGAAMVEFAIVLVLLLTVVLAGIEFDRMLLVYTSVANAAGVGARYAIVHGSSRTGTGSPASGAVNGGATVITVVKNWAQLGFLDPAKLNVVVDYPSSTNPKVDPGNTPGSQVVVTVTYPYDPLTFIPLNVNLKSTSRGVIVF